MLTLKKLRAGSLVLGMLLLALSSLGCSNGQIPVSRNINPYSTLFWSPDGSQLIFSNYVEGTFVVDVAGTRLNTIPVNTPLGDERNPGSVAAVLSPDGSRVAYVALFNDGSLRASNAEIMLASTDGTHVRRLTYNLSNHDTVPVWSPDGKQIAFVTSRIRLSIMEADGSNVQKLVQLTENNLVGGEPTWSPNGRWIAFSAYVHSPSREAIYVVRSDGSDIVKLGGPANVSEPVWSPDGSRLAYLSAKETEDDTVLYVARPDGAEVLAFGNAISAPAWSPDGNKLAFFRDVEGGMALFTAHADGSDRKQVLALAREVEGSFVRVSWSSDGSALFFITQAGSKPGIGQVVSMKDGSILAEFEGEVAEWSPDGTRVAVLAARDTSYDEKFVVRDVLYTMARDGTDRQVLVRGSGMRLAAEAELRDISRSVAACGEGYVVPWPENNPGLVKDCETLLGLRDQLAGDVLLNWNLLVPIGEWEGVRIRGNPSRRGDPSRVRGLGLTGNPMYDDSLPAPLNGILPPGLGQLSALESLDLRDNSLTGSIPTELGNLSQLEYLHLGENSLTGSIPAELGNLGKLGALYLFKNNLTGSIPPELGNLANLRDLYLYDNNLSGCMPVGLSSLDDIRTDGLEYCE